MKRKGPELDALRRRIGDVTPKAVDELYGLEPLFEPGEGIQGLLPEEFVAYQCPYCGERLEARIDLTAGETARIEDCEVCCRPIELLIELEDNGALRALGAQRID